MTTTQKQNSKPQVIVTLWSGEIRKGIARWMDDEIVVLDEGDETNSYYLPRNVELNPQRTIATITEDRSYLKPFDVKVLKAKARYAEHIGRYETAEEACQVIDALGATPVSEYRFKKEISCF